MQSLVIFASGTGTNTRAIINYFRGNKAVTISLIVTNNPDAGVLDIARTEEIPFLVVNKKTFHETLMIEQIQAYNPDLLVLAGFLWKIPESLINAFHKARIINIHPALLPAYGGKGMYGAHVHEAVIRDKQPESGITIHWVNQNYDEGNTILQVRCSVAITDTPNTLASRIHKLEHYFLPRTIEFLLDNN